MADRRPLDEDYVPERPVALDRLTEDLREATQWLAREGTPTGPSVLYGPPGVGKTLATRRLLATLSEHCTARGRPIPCHYVNAQRLGAGSVLLRWLRQMDPQAPQAGMGWSEAMALLNQQLRRLENPVGFLAIDEIDKCRGTEELLPMLTRPEIGLEARFQVLLVSNTLRFKDDLSDYVRETVGGANDIVARGYSADDLLAIVRQRAELALRPESWHESALSYLVAQVQRGDRPGNARAAVDLLRASAKAAEIAGSHALLKHHIDEGARLLARMKWSDSIRAATIHHKAALVALALLHEARITEPTTKVVHQASSRVRTRLGLDSLATGDRVRQVLMHLASFGLVQARTGKVASGRGRTSRWSVKDPEETLRVLSEEPDMRAAIASLRPFVPDPRWSPVQLAFK